MDRAGNISNLDDQRYTQALPKKRKKRFYEKIVTNTKYKDLDEESCGSAYFKDLEFGNDELDLRDLIKKVEARSKRREARKRKKAE